MATDAFTEFTYADLTGFPDHNLRREIIDGELIVTPSSIPRHQDAVMVLSGELYQHVKVYERFGVPEYWYVDLDADRVEIHRLTERRFGPPTLLVRTDRLESPLLPGWSLSVDEVLGPPEA